MKSITEKSKEALRSFYNATEDIDRMIYKVRDRLFEENSGKDYLFFKELDPDGDAVFLVYPFIETISDVQVIGFSQNGWIVLTDSSLEGDTEENIVNGVINGNIKDEFFSDITVPLCDFLNHGHNWLLDKLVKCLKENR